MPEPARSTQPSSGQRRRARARAQAGWTRWTFWLVAAIAAGLVLWALSVAPPGHEPLEDIDAQSRRQLDDALRDAERAEPAP
jgi:hypothetical protein